MTAFIIALHVIGFLTLFGLVVPQHYNLAATTRSSRSGSAYSPTPSAYVTPSTPITSPLSTTPLAS